MIDQENNFYCQLAKAIQAWGWIETEIYLLYAAIMKGANTHLVSVTFHHIESFESKIQLLDSCLKLLFDRSSDEYKEAKKLLNKSRNLNEKRNKIVHEPVIIRVEGGIKSIIIHPSHFDARALTKGKTTHQGPVICPEYRPSLAKITENHEIDIAQLFKIEGEFKTFSREIKNYRKKTLSNLKIADNKKSKE